jgi:hypothetical protein
MENKELQKSRGNFGKKPLPRPIRAQTAFSKRAARFLRGWLDDRRQESALNKH